MFEYENQNGYRCLSFGKVKVKDRKKLNVLREFPNLNSAKGMMTRLIHQFELCQNLCSIDKTGGACFYFHLNKCKGACIGEESTEDYNERIEMVKDAIKIDFEDDFFIIDKGRETDERSIVLIEEGIYRGYGYVHLEELNNHPDELKESIKPLKHHPEIVKIIHSFLSKDKKLKRLIF